LNRLLGYKDGRCTSIGHSLGCVKLGFKRLEEKAKLEEIPTLNALVSNSTTGIPSESFSYVHPKYNEMDLDEKRILTNFV